MAKCKDCIRFVVCELYTDPNEEHLEVGGCDLFISAADMVEVRHVAWNDNIIGFCNVCMECGVIVGRDAIKNRSGELNYCPNCGAKMDGKDDGE